MVDPELTSTSNPRIKRLIGLKTRESRDREGAFLVEGARHLERALAAGQTPIEVYYVPGHFDPSDIPGVEAHSCSDAALSRASYRGSHDGLIAVFRQFDHELDRIQPGSPPLLLLAEGLEKPGNLGAILRTADAVSADAVVAIGDSIDVFNPNVVRASTGALFTVPVAVAELAPALDWLSGRGIELIAASPDGADTYWSADLSGPCALVVGSESDGLSAGARDAADRLVRIPMHGMTDSLNASVSMALLAYEALRQRKGAAQADH